MNVKVLVPLLLAFSLLANSQWVSQTSGTNLSLLDIDFVSQTTGYAVGGPYIGFPSFPEGIVLKTTDSGETWDQLTPPGDQQLSSVCFINSTYGWVAGAEHIYKTIDAGESWSEQTEYVDLIGSAQIFAQAMDCIDANTAYIVGFNGVIIKTENGLTWAQQSGAWNGSSPGLFGISCVDADNCWAVGYEGTVLHTSNGGDLWEEQESQTHLGLNDVYFVDRDNGWLVGSVGRSTSRRTTNGGATWDNLTMDSFGSFRDIHFVNLTHGWMVGGSIIFTNNSGEDWYGQTSDIDRYGAVPSTLRGLDFPAENVGWTVGDDGVILRYGALVSPGDEPDLVPQCPALTYECDADFVPEWVYGEDGCAVSYTCIEPQPAPQEEQSAAMQAQNPLQLVTATIQGVVAWFVNLFRFQ